MAYTLAQAEAYLASEFREALADLGVSEAESGEWLYYVIRRGLRAVGVAESALGSATVSDANSPAFEAALDYYAWDRIARALAPRVGVRTEAGLQVAREQAWVHAKDERDRAGARAVSLGATLDDSNPPAVIQSVTYRDPYGVRDGILLGQWS
jgi:hypothetical protein